MDKYVSFLIEDIHKNVIEQSCNPELLNNVCVNDKPGAPFDISPVFFKREVLSKYINAPHKYSVSDGVIFFKKEGLYFRVDTELPEWVTVLLVDLASLDYNEQLYWRSYNISPKEAHISTTSYDRWYDAKFADPSAPDSALIQEYKAFCPIWEKHVGWPLFRTDPESPDSNLYALHLLSDPDNEKEFYEQILVFTKVFIDSLNVKQFPECKESGSINRFSAYLNQFPFQVTGVVEFLRMVQRLRSSVSAHNGKVESKVAEFFMFDKLSYGIILGSIFATMIEVLKTLMLASCKISDYNHSNVQN